jgi:hypothetical protein
MPFSTGQYISAAADAPRTTRHATLVAEFASVVLIMLSRIPTSESVGLQQ